jgi:hypothetical protein
VGSVYNCVGYVYNCVGCVYNCVGCVYNFVDCIRRNQQYALTAPLLFLRVGSYMFRQWPALFRGLVALPDFREIQTEWCYII